MPSGGPCAVADCKNRNQRGKNVNSEQVFSFHRFPKDPEVSNLWLIKCKRTDGVNVSNATVCSAHFLPSDFKRDLMNELLGLPLRKLLKPSAVPSIFPLRNPKPINAERGLRLERRNQKQMVSELLKANVDPASSTSSSEDELEGDYEFKQGEEFKEDNEFQGDDDSEGDEEEDEFEGEDEVQEDKDPINFHSRNQKVIQPKRGVAPGRRSRKQVLKDRLKTDIDPNLELEENSKFKEGEDEFEEDVEFKVEEPEPWNQAQVESRFNCLICKTLTTNEGHYLKDPKNVDELSNLFNKLCLAFKLKLPFQNQAWDFASEPFPFCGSCQEETLILCSLLDELESIEKEVSASVQKLSTLILTTESAGMTEVGPSDWNFPDHRRKEELEEKYCSFRKAVFERFNPKVNLLQCDQHLRPYSAQHLKPTTAAAVHRQPQTVATQNPGISIAPDIIDKDNFCDTELDPLWEPKSESCTQKEIETFMPATSGSDTGLPKPSNDTGPAAAATPVAKQSSQCKYWVRLVDETTKTYHIEGFEFREIENGYECLTCKNIYPLSKLRANRPGGKNKHRWGNVKIHIQKTHLRSLKGWCDICQKEYANLSSHKSGVHAGESARRLCQLCGKEFKSYNHLSAHVYMVHNANRKKFKQSKPKRKNFQCPTCGKLFYFKGTLNSHSRTHTKEKPFMCEHCGKCFALSASRKIHVDSVHGEKNWSCDQCGGKFGLKQSLQRHVKRIHGGIIVPLRKTNPPTDPDGSLDT